MEEKIGLIAGNRRLPLLFAQQAKKRGFKVVAVGIKNDTSSLLRKIVDKIYWIGLEEFNKIFKIFKEEGVEKIVLVGQISPKRIFSREVKNNQKLQEFLGKIPDKRAASIFGTVAEELEKAGFLVLNSTTFMEEYLPKKGTLTQISPDFLGWEDIYFGLEIAREIAFLDIGQSVAVKDKVILAVEAFEGTDQLILRAARLSRGGFTLVKVSRPNQDERFDIPVVGLRTVKLLIRTSAKILAIEADKTLFIDKEESIKLANKKGLCIVAI